MSLLERTVKYVFNEVPDPQMAHYPFLENGWQLASLLGLYLYGVYYYLPAFVVKKPPYKLTTVIRMYNVFQVVACSYVIYGIMSSGWTLDYVLSCKLKETGDAAARLIPYLYTAFLIRIVELLETIFFILRKKFNQVSVLHVYHHVSTIVLGWLVCKYYPGGLFSVGPIVNSFIHIIMYSYYFLTSYGSGMQKKLQSFKPKLTLLQLVQLVIFVMLCAIGLKPSCKISKFCLLCCIVDITILICLFTHFYRKSYLKKNTKM